MPSGGWRVARVSFQRVGLPGRSVPIIVEPLRLPAPATPVPPPPPPPAPAPVEPREPVPA
jgi:hypothetical protein